jgi:SRSO17 transposase
MDDVMTTAPVLDLTQEDLAAVLGDLESAHQSYSPVVQRREPREHAGLSLRGLLSRRERQSVEPMVVPWVGVDRNAVRRLPCFLSRGAWDDAGILKQPWSEVARDLGADDGVLMTDGSDCPKQGKESVGVKRPDGGPWGQRANGQAGVLVGDARRQGDTWLDRRLSLPAAGLTDEAFAERRRACGIPAETTFRTTPALALEMREAVVREGTRRCRWVTAEAACGRDTVFWDGVAAGGLWSCAEVPHDTSVGLEPPATVGPEWGGRGRQPTHPRLAAGAPPAQTVAAIAAHLPPDAWPPPLSQAGSQGPRLADFAWLRVVAGRDRLPGPDVWLILRRHPEPRARKTSLSTAPVDTQVAPWARIRGRRWPIDTCVDDRKPWLGRGDDEGRRWTGWHQQLTWVLLAHFLVGRTMLTMKKTPRP